MNISQNSGNLTLDELNSYIQSLKEWIEQARSVQTQNHRAFQQVVELVSREASRGGAIQFRLPPLWKRLAAEVVDFIILFTFKLYLTVIIFYNFDFSFPVGDTDDLASILENPEKVAAISTELALLEIVYRIVACIYETFWLHGPEPATPGKFLLGLRVYHADDVLEINGQENPAILVNPTTLGWYKSFYRALLKNILLGVVMFPMCFGVFMSKFNRTVYDILVGTVVVESNPNIRLVRFVLREQRQAN